jgi:hypothetical protein
MDTKRLLAAFFACTALTAAGADRGELFVEAGRGDEIDVAGMGWNFPFAGDREGWQWRGLLRLALLRGREPPPAERTIWVASFIPSVRRHLATFSGANLYFDAGIGVSGLSHTRINSERRLSTAFQFSELAGLTLEVGGGSAFSLRLQHISNGGIKHPNDGVTFASIVYSHRF